MSMTERKLTGSTPVRSLLASILPGLFLLAAPTTGHAREDAAQESATAPAPRHFASSHRARIGGKAVRYEAQVDRHIIANAEDKPAASVFVYSYLRSDQDEPAKRPVIFAFNGGPGSASLWLHLGLLGPRRMASLDAMPQPTTPPFALEDNADSPLDVADVVLIDPPGTGYSRLLDDGKPSDFYSVDADARLFVKLIEDWLRTHGRENSPRYLVSESYGTIRAATIARMMAGGPTATGGMDGITLNGIFMIGPIFEFTRAGDIPYVTSIPTMAATACLHGKVAPTCTPEEQVTKAREFLERDYVKALYAGSSLPAETSRDLATKLAALTGLSSRLWEQRNLRITAGDFAELLLQDEGKVLGKYDARFTLPASNDGGDPVADDPAMGTYVPGFVTMIGPYLRGELGAEIDDSYEAIAFRDVNGQWDYGQGPGIIPTHNYAQDLAVAMRRNPGLRAVIASGYYDLVTTLEAAQYSVTHSGMNPDAVTYREYASGHMAYLGKSSRTRLAADLRRFVQGMPLESEPQ